jgi:hypothetical protein
MVGLVGELASHISSPGSGETLVFGSAMNPWHLVLYVGIVVNTIGAAWYAFGLGSGSGRAVGASLGVLSVVVLLAASLAALRAAGQPQHASTAERLGDRLRAAAALSSTGADTGPLHHAHHHHVVAGSEGGSLFGHHHGKAGPVTAAERVVLNRELAAAKRATAKYRDIAVARANGYFKVTQFIPGLGEHLVNLGIPTFLFDPARPQVLLYKPVGGQLKLAGVAYTYAHVNDTPPDGFAGGSDVWHYHQNLCFTGGVVTIAASKTDCPGVFQQQTSWLLHAWIWIANPRGVFTEYNPRVT